MGTICQKKHFQNHFSFQLVRFTCPVSARFLIKLPQSGLDSRVLGFYGPSPLSSLAEIHATIGHHSFASSACTDSVRQGLDCLHRAILCALVA